jgi:hypothetical protein
VKRPLAGVKRVAGVLHAWLIGLFLLPLRAYQRLISPAFAPRCKYYPTCSAYAEQAVRELGIVRGTIVAAWRLVRCNPYSNGGLDPLEERSLFRGAHAHDCADHAHPTAGA